ncbi:MAG: hypothetical protein QXW57_03970 [Candidatus Micrarchaeaceae archaeon]
MSETNGEDIKATIDYIERRVKNLSRASDKLENALATIMKLVNDIDIFFNIEDNEPLYQYEGDNVKVEYRFAIDDGEIAVFRMYWSAWNGGWNDTPSVRKKKDLDELSMKMLKLAVLRLPKFLMHVADTLEKKEAEYTEVVDMAERMAAVVSKKSVIPE